MNVNILAAGEFPRKIYPQMLLAAEPVVCCDSALHGALRHKLNVDAVVGDMDSVPRADLKKFSGEIIRVEEQDDNDLTKALRYVLEKYPDLTGITIFGASGKREDHTVANLSLLMEYEKQYGFWGRGITVQMISDYSTTFAVGDSCELMLGEGRSVSLFTCDPSLRLRSEGLQWPLDEVVFDNWWKASLNRATADCVKLTFNHPAPLLIILD